MEKNLSGDVTNSATQKIAAKPHTTHATVNSSKTAADNLAANQETANFSPPANTGNQSGGSNKSDGR
jgi:hypothetical protein